MDAEKIVQEAIKTNPEIRLVLEIAMRAREAECKEAPLNIGLATEIVAVPTNLPCPVPPVTFG
jgi:hypothetical protein